MSMKVYKDEALLLEKVSSENHVTYFRKDMSEETDCVNVNISEFFTGNVKAEFACSKGGETFYIIVGEIDIETSAGDHVIATKGQVVSIPYAENLMIKICTDKYGKFVWIRK